MGNKPILEQVFLEHSVIGLGVMPDVQECRNPNFGLTTKAKGL
jgi:hypothetical protein